MLKFKTIISAGFAVLLLGWTYYPTFLWMVDRWMARDSYYTHGFLVPLVTLYWIFKKRKDYESGPNSMFNLGTFFLIAGVLLQLTASVLRIYFVSAFSFVFILLAILWHCFGWKNFKRFWFPVAFLFTMVPLPLLAIAQVTFKMKLFVSKAATFLINFSGIEAAQQGSYIYTPNAMLLVGDPCSGLRSFLAFLCLGLIFAYESKVSFFKRSLLVIAGFPLAILSNIVRVYGLGMIGEIYGMEYTHGFIHDASGVVVFVMAFACFMWLRASMEVQRG